MPSPSQAAPRVRAIRIWSAVHTWSSLVSMAFLLLLCVTGLPLIFNHEIKHALGLEIEPPAMAADAPRASLDAVIAAAMARRPGDVVQFVGFERDEPNAAIVTLGRTPETRPEDCHFVSVDLRTAQVLDEPKLTEGLVYFLFRLHVDLFLGLPGKLFLGAMGLLFLVAIVSGLVLYAPFMRKLEFGAVRRSRASRTAWLDWHNLAGVTTVTWALVVGGTGALNTVADLMVRSWQAGQLAEMVAPYKGAPRPETLSSLDAAVAAAAKAAPEREPRFVAYPGTSFSSANHYGVFLAGKSPLTSRIYTPVLVDAQTGRLTEMREMPLYMQALFVSQPLHFGDYGGLPLKIVWAILDVATIMVLGSGLYLWLARRKARGPASPGLAGVPFAAAARR